MACRLETGESVSASLRRGRVDLREGAVGFSDSESLHESESVLVHS